MRLLTPGRTLSEHSEACQGTVRGFRRAFRRKGSRACRRALPAAGWPAQL